MRLQELKSFGCPDELESKSMRGIGFICHTDPGGEVPSDTKVPLMGSSVPLFHRSSGLPEKARGVFLKQSSVRGAFAGHRRYWYPPP